MSSLFILYDTEVLNFICVAILGHSMCPITSLDHMSIMLSAMILLILSACVFKVTTHLWLIPVFSFGNRKSLLDLYLSQTRFQELKFDWFLALNSSLYMYDVFS